MSVRHRAMAANAGYDSLWRQRRHRHQRRQPFRRPWTNATCVAAPAWTAATAAAATRGAVLRPPRARVWHTAAAARLRPGRPGADVADPPLAHNDPIGYGSRGDATSTTTPMPAGHGHGGHAPLPNLIRTPPRGTAPGIHRRLDHMVIDVIGSLFDQILSDPKVPPQMARQIARLQLPVLRAALGDPTFFSSRRIRCGASSTASPRWATGFDDFSDERRADASWPRCGLVQEIVEGDFDQIETYERSWRARAFVAEQATRDVAGPGRRHGAAARAKEDELRLRQRTPAAGRRAEAVAAPAFVRDFVSRVWSRCCCVPPSAKAPTATGTAPAPRRPRAVHERAAQGHAGAAQGLPGRTAQADAGAQRGHEPDRLAGARRRPSSAS
jgi:hypothetical protein